MGVAAAVIGTIGMGIINGRAQQAQYEQQAAQYERQAELNMNNAKQTDSNADLLKAQAEEQAQNNKINEENRRLALEQKRGRQRALIGKSGITASGSAALALMDNEESIAREMGMMAYDNRLKVDNIFQRQTDLVNQRDQYYVQANDYYGAASEARDAGKNAFRNSLLSSAFSLATTLYTPSSSAAQETTKSAGTGSTGFMSFGRTSSGNYGLTSITSPKWNDWGSVNLAASSRKVSSGVDTTWKW